MYGISVLFSRVVRFGFRLYSKDSKKLLEFLADMSNMKQTRVFDAHRHKLNRLKKLDNLSPSTVYLQVLGSGARGVPNTLYMFTDQKRYLFNCGECTQRLAHEHKVKLSKLDHIFITGKSWRNIGGLPGLSLTLQDVGVPNITLHGPEGLDEIYNATKRFIIMKDMNVTMANCTPNEDYEDNVMSVKYVLLGPHDDLLLKDPKTIPKKSKQDPLNKEFEEFAHDDTDYYRRDLKSQDNNKLKAEMIKPRPKTATDQQKKKTEKFLHDLQKKSNCTVAYICTLKKRMGSLDLAKCVEMGVRPGPLLGQLKNGQDVVLPDGTLVLSSDVKTPDDPGPVFIVMEVPDLTYLKKEEFSPHFDNGENPPENIPALIVHYTPPNVFNHPIYREFMAMFGANTRHLVLNSQNTCLGSEAVHRTQQKLHLLDSEIFPMLRDASIPAVWTSHPAPTNDSPVRRVLDDLKNKIALAQFQNILNLEGSRGDGQAAKDDAAPNLEIMSGRTLTAYHLRPKRQIDRSAEPKLHIQDYIQEAMDVDGFVNSLEQFRRLIDNVRYAKCDSHAEYPKVVFLGTGSCIPSKTRNTSAIVLQIDENSSILLDCGEGTFGQLVRFYGGKKVNAFLRTLKAIYISHLHADHHIGLIGVIQARREALLAAEVEPEPVYLMAPGQIYSWITMYDAQFERIKPDITLIPNQSLLVDAPPSTDMTSAVLAQIGVDQVQTCLVAHCPNAFGVAIQIGGGHKITYSGDTLPCDNLVALGQDSTLLIHEATMEDELVSEARTKMHSTTSQAIDIGRKMNARYTVLTHFSQRYARLPRLNAHILNDNKSVGIAFDNMQITMSDLELLPHMYAPLQLMFADHCVEMEMKAQNRARQKERKEIRPAPAHAHTRPDNQNESHSGCRKASPDARNTVFAPTSHARYKESNSSRLRQEMKGMTVSGIVRKGLRSQSLSPSQRSTNSSPTRSQDGDALAPHKKVSERTIDLTPTPRTMSQTSCTSRDTDRSRVISSASSGCNGDARAKTLTAHPDKANVLPPNMCGVRSNIASGYGKPLVTPINKKLSIRRDTANEFAPNCVNPSKISRTRSPVKSWKAENRGSFSLSTKSPDSARTRIPTKEATSANSLRAFNTSPNVRRDVTAAGNAGAKQKRPLSSSVLRSTRSPTKEANIDCKPPDTTGSLRPSKIPTTIRITSTEKLKQQFCRDTPVYATGQPKPALHSNRSFKPQLEDIKTKYALPPPKQRDSPKPLDENQRKVQLVDVKKKFTSRRFQDDSRYDKIEGLNWISWK